MKWLAKLFGLKDETIDEVREAVKRNVEATDELTKALRSSRLDGQMARIINGTRRLEKRQ